MSKKALCVGINDYPYDGSDLKGCVNDARAWAELLTQQFGFNRSEVTLLIDDEALKRNVLLRLKSLIADAESGDVLVFTISSHGTYVADDSGDEPMYDEALCPYDCADNLIVDDELRELFGTLPRGVQFAIFSDSCYSGTVTRAAIGEIIPGMKTPDDRRVRFRHPVLRSGKILLNPWKARPKRAERHGQSKMKELLFSGCTDKEYSYDALIGGLYHGAMTYHVIKAIKQAAYRITYAELHRRTTAMLEEAQYPQHPQLEGQVGNMNRQVFT